MSRKRTCQETDPGMRSSQSIRLTVEEVKNLSAASGVAYIRLGAILTFLAAPNLAPKSIRNQHRQLTPFVPLAFLDSFELPTRSPQSFPRPALGVYAAGGYCDQTVPFQMSAVPKSAPSLGRSGPTAATQNRDCSPWLRGNGATARP